MYVRAGDRGINIFLIDLPKLEKKPGQADYHRCSFCWRECTKAYSGSEDPWNYLGCYPSWWRERQRIFGPSINVCDDCRARIISGRKVKIARMELPRRLPYWFAVSMLRFAERNGLVHEVSRDEHQGEMQCSES